MKNDLETLTKLLRYDIVTSTTMAGSGHPTTSLSGVELMTALWFDGHFCYDKSDPKYMFNDRMIFSKGHAAPLLYSLYHAAGWIEYDELMTLRKFTSRLEGHPTTELPWVDVATGSLGQGLSVGIGMALAIQLRIKNHLPRRQAGELGNEKAQATGGRAGGDPTARNEMSTGGRMKRGQNLSRMPMIYVLMGDSEFSEGQIYEALQLASHYKLSNLVGVLDVNRLGQRGETMLGWNIETYQKRIESFGWNTIVVENGNDLSEVQSAFNQLPTSNNQHPTMIIAKTKKGAGISSVEDKDGWHGKPLTKDMLEEAIKEIGDFDKKVRGTVEMPEKITSNKFQETNKLKIDTSKLKIPEGKLATREAYGEAIKMIAEDPNVVILDAETSNSTYSETMKKVDPERFFEMFIAEQNMVSVALGMSKLGMIPYASSFAAFLSRAYDQIRMCQYSLTSHDTLNIVGSHAGVSIGEDGASQMALEDIAMMRALLPSVVLYPSDPISTVKLVEEMRTHKGITYLRLTRAKTETIYGEDEQFPIGGSKVLRSSEKDTAVIIGAGITLHEALEAHEILKTKNIQTAVIDTYSVKPIDKETIVKFAKKTGHIVVVEDHYPDGGIGDAVRQAVDGMEVKFTHLCVRKIPRSGTPDQLLEMEEINAKAIVKAISQFSYDA